MSVRLPIRLSARAALLLASAAGALSTAQAQEPAAGDEDLITVTGRRVSQASEAIGEDKISNVVAVTREALLSAPSGISGLKMLEQLPGFNVQTDGALGLYEFGNSVQTRAFNLDAPAAVETPMSFYRSLCCCVLRGPSRCWCVAKAS